MIIYLHQLRMQSYYIFLTCASFSAINFQNSAQSHYNSSYLIGGAIAGAAAMLLLSPENLEKVRPKRTSEKTLDRIDIYEFIDDRVDG